MAARTASVTFLYVSGKIKLVNASPWSPPHRFLEFRAGAILAHVLVNRCNRQRSFGPREHVRNIVQYTLSGDIAVELVVGVVGIRAAHLYNVVPGVQADQDRCVHQLSSAFAP